LTFLQNDPSYSTLSQLVSEEEVLQTPNEVAEYEIKCSFLKLEKANVDASITELLAMEERGDSVDSDYLERLFKRRQLIQQSLNQQSAEAVDMVLTMRLGG
jgi:hypothetical protein